MAKYPIITAGKRITGNLLRDMLDDDYVKAAATTRNNTATLTADPDLQNIALAVGIYRIELVGAWTCTGSTTPKLKTRWIFSGTWNNPVRLCFGPGSTQTGAPSAVTDSTDSGYLADSQDAIYSTSTSSAYSAFREVAYNVTVSVAGNLSLHWAQATAGAFDTLLRPGTGFTIRRTA